MNKLNLFIGVVALLSVVACNKAKVSESSSDSLSQEPQVAASGSATCDASSYAPLNMQLPEGAFSVFALCFSKADLSMDAGGLPVIHLVGIATTGGAFQDPSTYGSFDITSHLLNFSGAQQSWIVEAAQSLKVPHVGVGGDSVDLLIVSSSMSNTEDIDSVMAAITRNGAITDIFAQGSDSSGTAFTPGFGSGSVSFDVSLPLW